jgi:signal transduction histidine kinase
MSAVDQAEPARAASFTAVSFDEGATGGAAFGSLRPAAGLERRRVERRLLDLAVAATVEALRAPASAFALALAAAVPWFVGKAGVLPTVSLLLIVGVGVGGSRLLWLRRDRPAQPDPRRTHRNIIVLAAALYAVAGLQPWAGTFPSPVATLMLALLAALVASALAPLWRLAAASAVMPASAALAALWAGPPALALAVASALAAAAVVLQAQTQHRRWYNAARASVEQADQLRQLEAARDAAIKADLEKSRFLAIASHDLRQPVHAIGLFAATLEKRLEGTADEPLVRNLNRAIDGLDRSFNVLLDISRLDAGAVEPRVQQFPLRDLFRRLHMHFAGQAEQKGLGLRFSPGGKSISSDPQLLERVLGNLVQNAIKYTESGGIVVVARSTASHIHVEIWDTGVGIREVDLHKVFDEFYQVGRGERVRAQGLGMGLAIVKRLVRLLGHELTISSRPGRGTMFRLRVALGGLSEIQDVTAAADTLPLPIAQPRTVLVLDDEEPIREGLRDLLLEWGYDAIAAGSIGEALRAVTRLEAPPDLILSDLHLGDGPDGIAGIEAIRRQCGFEVPAMLVTGDTSHAEIRRATESGHPVLFKPVQPRKLYDALRGLSS